VTWPNGLRQPRSGSPYVCQLQAAQWRDWGTGAQVLDTQGCCVYPREDMRPVLKFMRFFVEQLLGVAATAEWPRRSDDLLFLVP